MPAPKQKGKIPVSAGIVQNKKFNFWMVHQSYNKDNVQDLHEFFSSKGEAEERYNKLHEIAT